MVIWLCYWWASGKTNIIVGSIWFRVWQQGNREREKEGRMEDGGRGQAKYALQRHTLRELLSPGRPTS
jgi:hypothetical protein